MKGAKMKGLLISLSILMTFALTLVLSNAQTDQVATANSQLSQSLVREGTLAVKLADALQLGAPANEAEGEDLLSAAGITPRNGWIADYPLTPDIIGELQTAIDEAADSGKLSMSKAVALNTFQDVITGYGLAVKPDMSGQSTNETSNPNYPDSEVENNYYESEGPPVVTYYAPPPDYAYLYTWVPYPFWWTDFWFPGFFILVDFNVRVHHHDRDHDKDHGELISNHFHDPRTGKIARIDPANRIHGGASPQRTGAAAAAAPARDGAQAILNKSRGRAVTGATREFRGYGVTQNPVGTRSSAFEHSVNSQVEHRASDRGFQSRSGAGQIPTVAPGGRGGGDSGGRAAGGGGFHGGGRHN
jgi:hypothetical protein